MCTDIMNDVRTDFHIRKSAPDDLHLTIVQWKIIRGKINKELNTSASIVQLYNSIVGSYGAWRARYARHVCTY